jgi:hypothetical protein
MAGSDPGFRRCASQQSSAVRPLHQLARSLPGVPGVLPRLRTPARSVDRPADGHDPSAACGRVQRRAHPGGAAGGHQPSWTNSKYLSAPVPWHSSTPSARWRGCRPPGDAVRAVEHAGCGEERDLLGGGPVGVAVAGGSATSGLSAIMRARPLPWTGIMPYCRLHIPGPDHRDQPVAVLGGRRPGRHQVVHKLPRHRTHHVIDYPGTALLGAAVTVIILLTTWGGTTHTWGSAPIISLAVRRWRWSPNSSAQNRLICP